MSTKKIIIRIVAFYLIILIIGSSLIVAVHFYNINYPYIYITDNMYDGEYVTQIEQIDNAEYAYISGTTKLGYVSLYKDNYRYTIGDFPGLSQEKTDIYIRKYDESKNEYVTTENIEITCRIITCDISYSKNWDGSREDVVYYKQKLTQKELKDYYLNKKNLEHYEVLYYYFDFLLEVEQMKQNSEK